MGVVWEWRVTMRQGFLGWWGLGLWSLVGWQMQQEVMEPDGEGPLQLPSLTLQAEGSLYLEPGEA